MMCRLNIITPNLFKGNLYLALLFHCDGYKYIQFNNYQLCSTIHIYILLHSYLFYWIHIHTYIFRSNNNHYYTLHYVNNPPK